MVGIRSGSPSSHNTPRGSNIGAAERRSGDRGLKEVLPVGAPESLQRTERNTGKGDGNDGADDGAVRSDPHSRDELKADDDAQEREEDADNEGGGLEGAGVQRPLFRGPVGWLLRQAARSLRRPIVARAKPAGRTSAQRAGAALWYSRYSA